MAKRHERTRARRCALQVLYTSEIQGAYPRVVAASERFLSEDGDLPDYAQKLFLGVEAHQAEIDRHLASTSENWALSRMPIVDRSILRLAAYEMLYVEDVPVSVTINEAVELAKDFGGEDESPRFVNGVLGRIAKQLEEEAGGTAGEGAEAAADVADAPAGDGATVADEAADAAPVCTGAAAGDAVESGTAGEGSDAETGEAADGEEVHA